MEDHRLTTGVINGNFLFFMVLDARKGEGVSRGRILQMTGTSLSFCFHFCWC